MKRLFKLILPVMIMAVVFTVPVDAASASWQSAVNAYSKNVTYTLTVTPVRTGETKARVNWALTPSWPNGGEGHGAPTKITATLRCGGWSKTMVIKNAGSNTLNRYSGSFDTNVSSKQTSVNMSLSATGSGYYNVQRTVSYTYYTTEYYSETYTVYWVKGSRVSRSTYYRYARGTTVSKLNCRITYETEWYSYSQRHTGYKTVTDTYKTNSGTLSNRSMTAGGMEQYFYVSYDAVGGKPTPSTHGFIGGQSTRISSTKPLYYCEDIKSDGYRVIGWSTTRYSPNAGSPDSRYDPGDTYSTRADLKLYAVYSANQIGPIVYHANGGNANSIPPKQNKYYNVDIKLSSVIPTHPEVTNKGERYYFLGWNTKPDGSGYSYNAGTTFALNKNPHEPLPQVNKGINLYAIWYQGEDVGAESKNGQTTPNIRYIDKEHQDTLTENSKWKTGVRQTELEDSLNKDGQNQAKRAYDSEGNLIVEH